MQLNQFLTEYDDELSGDSYIDPLGVLVIWSAFGQQIFRNRVNSISNDVRNYTLNLLHHTLIRDLCDDDAVQPSKALVEEVGDKHSLALRQACLVYLENIFTYAMVAAPANAGVDSLGILGASKARARLEAQGNPQLQFTHKKAGYLLVRQLGLGVSGRYKTPFMEMGFFNATYNYHHKPDAAKLWDKTHLLIQGCERLAALYKEAKAHLLELLQGYRRKSRIAFDDLPASLLEAYRKALPSPRQVGADTRDFWLDITGLASGAAGALLSVLDEQAQQSPELPLPVQQLFSLGRQRCGDPVEQQKLLHVQTLEPLLAEADLLFTLAHHAKNQSITEIEAHWQALGRNASTLPNAASQIEELPSLMSVLAGTGQKRLGHLLKLARTGSFAEQLRGLLDYHALVMRGRGQLPWAQAQDFERIKVNARTTTLPTAEKWPAGRWVNSYYISQFRNLVAGYRGVQP
ncbi:hypothetical protein [Pseudomonas syringae]|uniref:Uncharacterized protein n=3 Tax=Pseudomonas syringae TaxID=317 RepID=A0A656K1U4_PSESF|nr:hypothetical protein [Pseudomonas syringae]EPN65767.1 hypothetical protein A245_07609 [Pseudomonas syringae pv. actinidiae ICMP 19096]EPM44379.1 hypothetical protein A246_22966 [Pseudomonas syringae pv. actinidiae ICMP 19098]EPM64846.1 hypothetical protein A249_42256 [Pseudomonas syringae pv. actinidiae ICMP 18804]EPN13934.1 hypothetical protein A248_28571 [Pseudomonas syringae pv. actinidiae ICMP 19100]EPN22779.1 hypothetical protein A247_27485 [Pseudomonas syringae pv. actinidiae ICMP 190